MNPKDRARWSRLFRLDKKGRLVPRFLRVYDNGHPRSKARETCDRYTAVFHSLSRRGRKALGIQGRPGHTEYVGMSNAPFHPQGVGLHGEHDRPIDWPTHAHLGVRISFADLPEDCQLIALQDYCDWWEINTTLEQANERAGHGYDKRLMAPVRAWMRQEEKARRKK